MTIGAPAFDPAPTRSRPALLIDSDADCREALGLLISDVPGIGPVWPAARLDDALRIAREEQPAIVYLDCPRCPEAMAIVQALRAAAPAAALALLCLYPERLPPALAAVVDQCVHKDVTYAELAALTQRLLAERRRAG